MSGNTLADDLIWRSRNCTLAACAFCSSVSCIASQATASQR